MTVKNKPSGLKVDTIQGSSVEITQLLENTTLGTPGKLRYKPTNIQHNLKLLKGLEFIQIKKGHRVLGTTGVINRKTNTTDSLFVRYLSVFSPQRVVKAKPASLNISKNNRLKHLIGSQLTNHFEEPFNEQNKSGCFYAYVESENFQSKNLCELFGFNAHRTVQTLLFSRFFPKKKAAIHQLEKGQDAEFKYQLERFYDNHSFVFTEDLDHYGDLYTLNHEGRAIAGLRAKSNTWNIIEIPGFNGFLMQYVLPYLPLFKRLFSPKNLNFIAFDCTWYEDGWEHAIPELMEHACAHKNTHMGMFWGDAESNTTQNLLSSKKLGFLNKITPVVSAFVMLRPINITPEKLAEITRKPVFVSAVDMT